MPGANRVAKCIAMRRADAQADGGLRDMQSFGLAQAGVDNLVLHTSLRLAI